MLLFSQSGDDYMKNNFLRYDDYVYRPNIQTVQLYKENDEITYPFIRLNSNEYLELHFDDLNAKGMTYSYTVIHCSSDWEPSPVFQSEYLNGFYQETFNSYQTSFNTLQLFTHYTLKFPSESMRITKSGNYLLMVYSDFNKDSLVLTRRFAVYENSVQVPALLKEASIISDRNYKHEIDFKIISQSYNLTNPYSDLKIILMQNGRWDNAIKNLQPVFVKDRELDFDLNEGNSFWALNEYRWINLKNVRNFAERVVNVQLDSGNSKYVATLATDPTRSYLRYLYQEDINGKFVIRGADKGNHDLNADYIKVIFSLKSNNLSGDGNVYVFGSFSDWKLKPEYRMMYDFNCMCYKAAILLKQGFYNYDYAFSDNKKSAADETTIEGSHYDTENDYFIFVYHRATGTSYEQLIGFQTLNSSNKKIGK